MARPKGSGGANATSFGSESGNKRGRGPKRGAPNAGPPTHSFLHFLANLRHDAKTQLALRAAVQDPESRGFSTGWKVLSEYDEAKPAQKQEHKHDGKMTVVFERESKKRTAG